MQYFDALNFYSSSMPELDSLPDSTEPPTLKLELGEPTDAVSDDVQAGAAIFGDELNALLEDLQLGDREPKSIEKKKKQEEARKGGNGGKPNTGNKGTVRSSTANKYTGAKGTEHLGRK